MQPPQKLRKDSLLEDYRDTANLTELCPRRPAPRGRIFDGKAEKRAYSAARASEAFGFAAEIMKS
jgi:hypothetical protein